MTLPRILSAVGRTLAILGLVMLLFVVFQLWGTGLQQAQAQSDLEGDFAERFRRVAEAGQAAPRADDIAAQTAAGPTAGAAEGAAETEAAGTGSAPQPPAATEPPGGEVGVTTSGESGTIGAEPASDPSAAPETAGDGTTAGSEETVTAATPPPVALPELPSLPYVVGHISETASARGVARLLDPAVEETLPLVYPEAGEAIARIIIPSIDVDEIVVAGVEVEDLRRGPGHYSTTPLPGQPGNAAIAGHRTTYGAPFGRLNELNAGDSIIVETLQGQFVYRVLPGQPGMAGHALGFRIVAPTALEVLDDVGDNRLTLTSCHPKYSSRKRIIVHAALVGDPVVRLPRPGEPIGAEYVQLAESTGPPPVPLDVSPPQEPAPEEAGTETAAAGDRAGDTATVIPGAEPTIPGVEREAPPAGERNTATAGEATAGETSGDSGSGEGSQQANVPDRPPASQAQATPVTDVGFGEGLSGDRSAILPAVLWGLAAAAVLVLGWTFGRSGRRALRYTVAVVPFLVVLYVMFSYVDRALPAY